MLEALDALTLARIQFAFTVSFHLIFPAFSIGLASYLAVFEALGLRTGRETFLTLFQMNGFAYVVMDGFDLLIGILFATLALILRGVALEFRWRDPGHRPLWDFAFSAGSIVAALAQGITLGAVLQGIAVKGRGYGGGWWDWLSPFSLLTGASVCSGSRSSCSPTSAS